MSDKPDPVCPVHHFALRGGMTRYGKRLACPVDGCTVLCWAGKTSTPADAPTRALRNECHNSFDPMWIDPDGPFSGGVKGRKRFHRRVRAYRWLAEATQIHPDLCHFGMFDAAQCRTALDAIRHFRKSLLHDPQVAAD